MNDCNFFVVGLTGPTGSGKTTVSEVFRENGYYVINCDEISREVTENSSACLKELVHEFSEDILDKEGNLDRRKLGDIVFGDNMKKTCLEGVIYPYILAKILDRLKEAAAKGIDFVLLDAPTLFESNADDLCDLVVCVIASEKMRYENIIARDGLTLKQAQMRMESQKRDDFYISKSDIVIRNEKDIETLKKISLEVAKTVKEYSHV